ncbi:MAG: tetratricopeptide repeat protein [Acidobacteriota bacterium]
MARTRRSTSLHLGTVFSLALLAGGLCLGQEDFDVLSRQADTARAEGRLDDAATLYRQLVDLRPDWQQGRWFLGTILYDQGKYDEALQVFQSMVTRWPHHGPAVALSGLCQFQMGEYQQALQSFQQGRTLGLGDNPQMLATIRYHAALCLNRLGQFDAAYEALRVFAYENHQSRGIIRGLGLSALRLPYLPDEVPAGKDELVTMMGRAAFEGERGERARADALYRQILEKFPQEPGVHYAYGAFLLRDHGDDALDQFIAELKCSPDDIPALMQLTFEYLRRGDFDRARPFAERTVRVAPEQFAGHNALGRILLETGDVDGAIRELETAVKLAPLAPENRLALSSAYLKAARKEDALRERAEYKRLSDLKREAQRGLEERSTASPPPRR